ncbi:hypothetical protein LTR53_013932 [Teratosphaeriaceae sp. CCFEE 6253]|nr:hypothetical protein LTR53_013932 [Teratosphaeriaceae sp. CCFEE 6253]
MAPASPDDELLAILLTNLRNAKQSFGEGTPPYESIRTTIEEHVNSLKAAGLSTNLTGARKDDSQSPNQLTNTTLSFSNLAIRPKPRE